MFGYIGIVYALILDLFIFKEGMNWAEWLGSAVIIVTTLTLTLRAILKNEKAGE